MRERRFVDLAYPINARSQDRYPDGEPRHDRVRHRDVAPGLHDVQLANAGGSCSSPGQGIAGPSDGRLADDISAFVLVDGVRLVRLRQSADRAGKTAARAGI